MLCAGALANVESFSLPAEVFCATGHVRAICSVPVGRDENGDPGGRTSGVTLNSLLKQRGGGHSTPRFFSVLERSLP